MKPVSLIRSAILASSLMLCLFATATLALMYRAQTQLSTKAMDSLVRDDSFSLSALVNAIPGGKYDFELTPLALSNYKDSQEGEFFRFLIPGTDQMIRQSPDAPDVACALSAEGSAKTAEIEVGGQAYRIHTHVFKPEIDEDFRKLPPFPRNPICLVVGIEKAPYLVLVRQTFLSTIPVIALLVVAFVLGLTLLLRIFMRDLALLNQSLLTADFKATHAFPSLPRPRTEEVSAVVEKLRSLHDQASAVYTEMWLFLGRAAHQLKTPVTAIKTTLDVALRKERSAEELKAVLSDLSIAVDTLSSLTTKLITSSRISHQNPDMLEKISLPDFLAELLKIFEPLSRQRNVPISIEPGLPLQVMGTKDLLSELIGNLIENAVLYSRSGGKVTVSWTRGDGCAILHVTDSGHGFPKNVISNLFNPFVRGDEREVSGSGLGLSIAKKAAQILNGSIQIEHTGTAGSRIKIILPLSDS